MKAGVIAITTLLLSFTSSTLFADPYIGASVGSADYTVDLGEFNNGSNFEDSGTGTKIYGGYAFNKYYAAEVTYYNFAEASVGALETDPDSGEFVSASAKMKGLGAYAVGMYPVSKNINLMAKIGLLNWNADIALNNQSGSNNGTDLAYAIAASYAFTKEFLAVAEWEGFETDNPEVSMLSIGFKFIFR